MKTTLCFISTLLTLLTLAFVPNSFAQGTSPEYVVRQIYFHPRDLQPTKAETLDKLVSEVQELYADEMERHGFGRKTFRLETDALGEPVRHYVKGKFTTAHYKKNDWTTQAHEEIKERVDMDERFVYLVLIETDNDRGGNGGGGSFSGKANITHPNIDKAHPFIYRRIFGVVAHELAHAFGLKHDFRSDLYITSYGSQTQLSYCAAEWLDVHRYFNAIHDDFEISPTIQMLDPVFVDPPNTIRLRFEVTHSEKLHQAQLLQDSPFWDAGVNPLLIDCESLNTNNAIIEFTTDELAPTNKSIRFRVIDTHGNFTSEKFPIDIASLVPKSKPISIPDEKLEEMIRAALNLAHKSPITKLDIVGLTELGTNVLRTYSNERREKLRIEEIANLEGLQHAINLKRIFTYRTLFVDLKPIAGLKRLTFINMQVGKVKDIQPLAELTQLSALTLSSHQISNIRPLTKLTNLSSLSLNHNQISNIQPLLKLTNLLHLGLRGNKIKDITPLTELTKLNALYLENNKITDITPLTNATTLLGLYLSGNQIQDVRPLAKLTNLRLLHLNNNQIEDVHPLTALTSLEVLRIEGNPIKNKKPLLALLKKNPNMKIYLKNDSEPLPVTLSYFHAEHTDAGVILKWTTEAEVDNAGFYIYRSETRDGTFKVVNPTLIQGAGTTSERNTYTWKDTTAKPNTVYYYRIEDISHAGVRKQLATVRLRGLVSASGKLTTRWADLKAQQ